MLTTRLTSPPASASAPPGRRRRAARACRMCKARKVRCDGQIRKNNCTNCQLDGYVCVVDERRVRKQGMQKSNPIMRPDDASGPEETSGPPPPPVQVDALDIHPHSGDDRSDDVRSDHPELTTGPTAHPMVADMDDLFWEPLVLDSMADLTNNDLNGQLFGLDNAIMGTSNLPQLARTDTSPPFVSLGNRSHLSQKEIDFLESENVFDLPNPPALDQCVRTFFLVVHPNLPVVDEATFWRAYKDQDQSLRLSLFVLNAMLCVSSGCVPPDIIHEAGYESSRQAGAAFYRRAKLLYDFGIEHDQIQVAIGALLLSYYTASYKSPQIVRNTSWLSIAVEVARSADAEHAFEQSGPPESQKRASPRLSWCCFVRDRFLSAGAYRPSKVHNIPDLDSLRTDVFEGDHGPNNVYDRETSRRLGQLFIVQCRLAVALTGVASQVCTPGVPPAGEREARTSLERIEACRVSLQQWFEESMIQFPAPSALFDSERNVTLCVNTMYIRYYACKMALAHREFLILHYSSRSQMPDVEVLQSRLCDIEECVNSTRELIKELLLLDLARYLSFGSMLHAAFPLILHRLDLKLASSMAQKVQREGRLKVFTELMDLMRESHCGSDGADNVLQLLHGEIESEPSLLHLLAQGFDDGDDQLGPVQTTSPNAMDVGQWPLAKSRPPWRPWIGWQDVLVCRRRFYFQLVLSLEVSLSQGSVARAEDIRPLLQAFQLGDGVGEEQPTRSSQ